MNAKVFTSTIATVFISVIALALVGMYIWFNTQYEEPTTAPVIANTNSALNTNSASNVNRASNTNTAVNTNTTSLEALSRSCETDSDCTFASTFKDYSTCCPVPSCTDYSEDQWIAVNKTAFIDYKAGLQAEGSCSLLDCPDVSLPFCEPPQYDIDATCNAGTCVKKNVTLDAIVEDPTNTNATVNTNTADNTNTSSAGNTNVADSTQSYSNQAQLVSFSYPESWVVVEGTVTFGMTTGTRLTFQLNGETLSQWVTIFDAEGYTDPIDAYLALHNYADDVRNSLTEQPSSILGGQTTTHMCGFPGLYSYCANMLLHNGKLYNLEYHENATFEQIILSTFEFTN